MRALPTQGSALITRTPTSNQAACPVTGSELYQKYFGYPAGEVEGGSGGVWHRPMTFGLIQGQGRNQVLLLQVDDGLCSYSRFIC